MRHFPPAVLCSILAAFALAAPAHAEDPVPFSLTRFLPDRREAQLSYEHALNASASAASLKAFHERLASEPHVAGSEGDLRMIDWLATTFRDNGLSVETHWIWPYLSRPVSAQLEILAPQRLTLNVQEPPLDADPFSGDPRLALGFNAYSGIGEAVGEVVYANFGTKEDFEKLADLGLDVAGRIVIARYGGNYRGYKARYAEEAGAAGLIIYTDPAQSGYMRGLMYPEGGWATSEQIQRGSIATLPWPGDPLTPFEPASETAARLDPDTVPLARIPVQPVGWAAAQEIMSRMTGDGVPETWQGAMPFAYRLTGGPQLTVRLKVEQERALTKTANVVATLRGSRYPDEWIIVGCHHDAWGFGASDPTAGTMLVMEAARCFAEAAKAGQRPDRSILFATWTAEEHGIIGSVEWVEAHRKELGASCVCYINLDMAAMGPLLGASGTPSLRRLILDAARLVPQARQPDISAFDQWLARTPGGDAPRVGSMGGGSDHIGFYFHVGAPTMSFGASGGRGTSYHSNYDTLHWYHMVVGDDYEPALMLTRVLNVTVARLANADVIPLDPEGYAPDLRKHLDTIEARAGALGVAIDTASLRAAIDAMETSAREFNEKLAQRVQESGPDDAKLHAINDQAIRRLESTWLDDQGVPGRPWYKSLYMAPDETSGYSAWPLPALRKAVEERDAEMTETALAALGARVERLTRMLTELE